MMLRVRECAETPEGGVRISYDDLGELYDNQNMLSSLRFVYFSILHRHRPLLSMCDVMPGIHVIPLLSAEIRCVPLEQIIGSENRSRDFDVCFRPVNRRLRDRWCHIARMMRNGEPLPPVDLISTHLGYFVRDGNHRVSVSHAIKLSDIDACVVAREL